MHITNKIVEEIVELSEIKKAYNHYLCTCDAKQDVENYTYIIGNKAIISYHLHMLYAVLAKRSERIKQKLLSATRRYTYNASKSEQNAIMHFNNDRRFTITE